MGHETPGLVRLFATSVLLMVPNDEEFLSPITSSYASEFFINGSPPNADAD